MSNLILELRPGEMMILNGAPLRFRTRTRVELAAHARFLFGRQIMTPEQADSPARKIYLALQHVYIGAGSGQTVGLDKLRCFAHPFREALTTPEAAATVDQMLQAAETERYFIALKLSRRLIGHEDAVTARDAAPKAGLIGTPDIAAERRDLLALAELQRTMMMADLVPPCLRSLLSQDQES